MDNTQTIWNEIFIARGYTDITATDNYMSAVKENNQVVHLYILTEPKLNIDVIKYYYTLFKEHGIKHGILIYHNAITSSVKKILELVYDIKIELFLHSRVQYNILKHNLVPTHDKIQKESDTDYTKYPILNYDDPVARLLDFGKGDLIRITRRDGSLYYRIVK